MNIPATSRGYPCAVTRHRQWRHLLAELSNNPSFRWLRAVTHNEAIDLVQPVVALARALAVWQPELIARDRLKLDLVGATASQCAGAGRLYGLLSALWGRPHLEVDLHLVGPQCRDRGAPAIAGLPPFTAIVFTGSYGQYRSSPAWRQPDLTVVALPGMQPTEDNWMVDDGLLEQTASRPFLWLCYDWDDAELHQRTMEAYGVRNAGPVDCNPFTPREETLAADADGSGKLTSWLSIAGTRGVPPVQRERILTQLTRVAELATQIEHGNALSQVHALGEFRRIDQADGTVDSLIVLGRRYYAHPITGDIVHVAAPGAVPDPTGLTVSAAWMAAYPAPASSRWVDRACWTAQVWLDRLDAHVAAMVLNPLQDPTPEEKARIQHCIAEMIIEVGATGLLAQQMRAVADPDLRQPIPPEHRPFVQLLNRGEFDRARVMLEAAPALAKAENDEAQTALFYACRFNHVGLATAFVDAGGDMHHHDLETWTALMEAAAEDHAEIIHLLAARGIDVDAGNGMGWTPLLTAVTRGCWRAARALVECGANLDHANSSGNTAREVATALGMVDVLTAGDERAKP